MNPRTLIMAITLLSMVVMAFGSNATVAPFVGNWVLNVGRSEFSGTPPLKSCTLTVDDAGADKLHIAGQWVNGDGSKGQDEFTAALDGTESRVTGYSHIDSVRLTTINSRAYRASFTRTATPIVWRTYDVAADGKTMRVTERGNDATGARYDSVEMFERQ
jgi:hypothetical protein